MRAGFERAVEPTLHRLFGRWANKKLRREVWDVVHCWSGVSEEILAAERSHIALTVLARGSSHIATQAKLLEEEARRTGVPQDAPSPWMIARECREYELADRIRVLSSFASKSFADYGFRADKIWLCPPGVDLAAFRPSPEAVLQRCQRIRGGEPLRVLNVGTVSYQKGIADFDAVIKSCAAGRFAFRFVGSIKAEARNVVRSLAGRADFVGALPQDVLPMHYAWGDLFVLPTIQDGFAVVLLQALSSGLPVLTTENSAGLDVVSPGVSGWVMPIRSPQQFVERLHWCDANRELLAQMVANAQEGVTERDWSKVARDFANQCRHWLAMEQHG